MCRHAAFYENNEFELVFKTLIANEELLYLHREITPKGDANIALGNGIAYLKDFVQINNTVDFRFEYGENLGMFVIEKNIPTP